MIEEQTVFVTCGEQFDTYEKAVTYRINRIGEFIDPMTNRLQLSPKQKIQMIEFFKNPSNRSYLRSLLDF